MNNDCLKPVVVNWHIRLLFLVAFAVTVAFHTAAEAQPRGLYGRASLEIDASVVADADSDAMSERDGAGSFGIALRALIGKAYAQYGVGFGYRFGSTLPGGFLYRVELLPIGVGATLSDLASFGVFAGVGLSGVTSRVPFAGIFPVEARLDFRLGKRIYVGGYARAVWTTKSERDGGSSTVDAADEVSAGLRLRLGKSYRYGRRAYGTGGYYVAGLVEESLGARFIGGAFGYSLDFGLK